MNAAEGPRAIAAPASTAFALPLSGLKVGLVCAGGAMPAIVAAEAQAAGCLPHLIAFEGLAEPEVERFPHQWVKIGQLGKMSAYFSSHGIRHVALIGGLSRPRLSDLRLDFGAIKALPAIARVLGKGGDDALLRRLITLIEAREGFTVVGIGDIAPALVLGEGCLGKATPSETNLTEARIGLDLLAALSPFDCGQAAVIIDNRPVAIEGIEGTDAMMQRVADLRSAGRLRLKGRRGVLVKAPKRGQDMRVDMPTIGPETMRRAAAAGLAGVAVEAGGVLVAGRQATARAAREHGLFVLGLAQP